MKNVCAITVLTQTVNVLRLEKEEPQKQICVDKVQEFDADSRFLKRKHDL